jgi:RimJ/RimL family protein N-acetyltransferase
MIETERLRLRAVEPGDYPIVHAWWNDPRVQRFQVFHRHPVPLEAVELWFRQAEQDPFQIRLLIEGKERGQHFGTADIFDIRMSDGVAELAVMIGEVKAWGRGYGPEAAAGLLEIAFSRLGLRKILVRVMAYNQGAIAAYQDQGFVVEGTLRQQVLWDGSYHDQVLLGILREEFETSPAEVGGEKTTLVVPTQAELEELESQMREQLGRIHRTVAEGY